MTQGLWIGPWLHEAPEAPGKDGRRAVMKQLCFGPAEARVWYALEDGRFCREVRFLEGLQAGERGVDFLSRAELQDALRAEAALCERRGAPALAARFRAEAERLS